MGNLFNLPQEKNNQIKLKSSVIQLQKSNKLGQCQWEIKQTKSLLSLNWKEQKKCKKA